jgi:hypothetical protein
MSGKADSLRSILYALGAKFVAGGDPKLVLICGYFSASYGSSADLFGALACLNFCCVLLQFVPCGRRRGESIRRTRCTRRLGRVFGCRGPNSTCAAGSFRIANGGIRDFRFAIQGRRYR